MAQVQHLDESSFEETIAQGKVLVDFSAEWCGPCKMMGPILEQLAQEVDNMTIAKIDVDNAESVAVKYDITSVPTLILFENGEPKQRVSGVQNLARLKTMIGE